MNPYLEKLSFQQLLELFVYITREFIHALETERSYKELEQLRDQIKRISEMIKIKKHQLKAAC